MLFFRSILIIFLLTTSVSSNEIPSIKFVSLDYIIKNSIIGKKLSKMNTDQRNSLIKKNKKIESDLQKQKDDILSKKNILAKKEFESKVISHQKKVKEYQNKTKEQINSLNKKNVELLKKLKVKIDQILIDYATEKKIDIIFKKEDIIVSNSKNDVTKDILILIDKKIKKIE